MRLACLLLANICVIGCGGSTDLGGADAMADGTTDGSSSDSATDSGGGDVLAPDGACECVPYWCGCGACDPGAIACTVNPPPCALKCMSSCTALQQTTCTCDQGRCIRHGIDAGSIGCIHDEDCPPGGCCAHVGAVGPGGLGHCSTPPDPCCVGQCK